MSLERAHLTEQLTASGHPHLAWVSAHPVAAVALASVGLIVGANVATYLRGKFDQALEAFKI